MKLEEAIEQLEFDRDMILFDPTTGEKITPEILKELNEDNYRAYVADGVAIEALKEIQKYREIGTVEEIKSAKRYIDLKRKCGTPTNTIDLCAEYIAIGTVEECREAREKQKPKEIYHQKWNGIDGVPYDLCPTCENNLCTTGVFARNKMNYCEKCGQKLCWNENMEDE